MKPSLRFLAIAILGWAGLRAGAIGSLPGSDLYRIERSEATVPTIAPTQFPRIEPGATDGYAPARDPPSPAIETLFIGYLQELLASKASSPRPIAPYPLSAPVPLAGAAPRSSLTHFAGVLPTPARAYYAELPPLFESPLSRVAAVAGPVSLPAQAEVADPHAIDRVQLATWAILRSQKSGVAGSRSLAGTGELGASQSGVRLIYNWNNVIGLAARLSSAVGQRGGEVAAGARVRPLTNIPIWITAERRQAIGRYGGGRNAFAFLVEGGLYGQQLPWRFGFDSYLQSGVVGLSSRDWFVDGAFAASRPVLRNFSAGFGVWGAAQPGLARLDVGPRLSMDVRNNLKVHLDWRQKLVGNALPGSGPALTLSGNF